jgi:putative Mg2+ transporter-C (MgtC) family protein
MLGIAGPAAWERLGRDFTELLDFSKLTLAAVRLITAAMLGGLLGVQRQQEGKSAGLRTFMLVSASAALFTLAPVLEDLPDLGRVLQGIIAGIGFIGGGTILKLSEEQRVRGLTTAAGIGMAAAIGIAVALGSLGAAVLGTILSLVVLAVLHRLEGVFGKRHNDGSP